MGKASRKKKIGTKFYFVNPTNNAIQTVYAETEEEAKAKLAEQFGELKVGTLPHAKSKEEIKEDQKAFERVAGELIGPAGKKAAQLMNAMNNMY